MKAANLLRRLGYGATIPDILDKFDSVYGETDSKEHLLNKRNMKVVMQT